MIEISVWFIVFLLTLVVMFGLFRRDANRERLREYYYLKNYKFLAENPGVVISKTDWQGEFWVSYIENGRRHYCFFFSESAAKNAMKKLQPYKDSHDIRCGMRLRDYPGKF